MNCLIDGVLSDLYRVTTSNRLVTPYEELEDRRSFCRYVWEAPS